MDKKKNIFVINGSASSNSTNLKIIEEIKTLTKNEFKLTIFNSLKTLPHFDPELSTDKPPKIIIAFRNEIERADGIIICTPEYIFSVPSGLKNAIEWCVSTTIFKDKPTGLITASANGEKGHEELQLIMKTVMARFTNKTILLIPGAKEKFNSKDNLTYTSIIDSLNGLIQSFKDLINK